MSGVRKERKKGRLERILAELEARGLRLYAVSGSMITRDGRITFPIGFTGEKKAMFDPKDPYRDQSLFHDSDYYRVCNESGETITQRRRLSGVLRWIEAGAVPDYGE